jgi:hypothetical protein
MGLGLMQFVPPLVNGEQPAEREQQNRHQEGPEIDDIAVAERMFLVRFPFRFLHAAQQQHLVAAIGGRMNRLCQHRARTGHGRGRAFRNQDAGVGAECVQNGA